MIIWTSGHCFFAWALVGEIVFTLLEIGRTRISASTPVESAVRARRRTYLATQPQAKLECPAASSEKLIRYEMLQAVVYCVDTADRDGSVVLPGQAPEVVSAVLDSLRETPRTFEVFQVVC